MELTLQGPIDLGRRSDIRVADRVISILRSEGQSVELLHHEDSHGDDRRIRCNGQDVSIQVVSVPTAPDFIRDASRGSANTVVSLSDAAGWINEAVTLKAGHYSTAAKAQMLLAVDVRAVGVLASPPVVAAVEQRFGDPCATHGFGAVWLVGPLESHSTRFSGSRW